MMPPVAKIEPKTLSIHGDDRIDDYFWVRDDARKDAEVLALLAAENQYTETMMAHTKQLQEQLFAEITHRLVTDDSTVPVKQGDYYYHREYRAGGEQPIYLRRKFDQENAEIILDLNELSKGHNYYNVGNWVVSNEGNVLAYVEDVVSRRIYTIRFKDLKTGKLLPDRITNVATSLAWANDNKTLFYVQKDPVTLLPFRVMKHVLGTPIESDQVVYEEFDKSFSTSVYTTRSKDYVVIRSKSSNSTEIQLIDAHHVNADVRTFLQREEDHEYRIRHVSGTFYIITNWQAENFRLMRVNDSDIGDKNLWQEVLAHRKNSLIEDVEVFNNFLVINERIDGLSRIKILNLAAGTEKNISFPEAAYTARLHSNPEIESEALRYVYSSLTTPQSVYEYDMNTGLSRLLKQDQVLGGFKSNNYSTQRIKVTARDGTEIPVSIVFRTDMKKNAKNPLYIYAYGSYGYSTSASFSSLRLSLLDRGFVFAIAHVRGGEEMGRYWYDQGKMFKKRNTFWDFIDVTQALVDQGYGDKNKVFAQGASAGGLLMGVIANEAPEKYLAIIAHVPFVDVVTTMLDETIPLTTGEFSEWGNPKDKMSYDYMLSYSPYDQVKKQNYPNMFVTTGLYDSQVQYYEPVKWVSKLRRMKLDDNLLIMDIDMETGHGGASGRYERYKTDALEYAFVIDVLKKSD